VWYQIIATLKNKILLLSLVHPDLLPPIYASSQVLRDSGYEVSIVCSSSTAYGEVPLGGGITVVSCGKYMGSGFAGRNKVRAEIERQARAHLGADTKAIISYCAYSYLLALKYKSQYPVVYVALEITDFKWKDILHSPQSAIRHGLTIKNLSKAALLATPSVQRSAWLAGRAGISKMPVTIHNTSYYTNEAPDTALFESLVPPDFRDKIIFLYTGAVNATQRVSEIVKGFEQLRGDNCRLIITRFGKSDYCNEIADFVAKHNLQGKVLLLPNIPREHLLALQAHAHIGFAFVNENEQKIKTQMIAPNKLGEYLANGLFIVGSRVTYMLQFEQAGVAELVKTHEPEAIAHAMQNAMHKINTGADRQFVKQFVMESFCMQVQFQPVVEYLNKL